MKVAVAGFEPLLNALGIDVDAEKRRARHGCRERLRATHAAHSAGNDQFARQISAKMFVSGRVKCLKGALHDSLRADVNPRAGRHLSVHHQAGALEFVEFLPVGPSARPDSNSRSARAARIRAF